MSSAAQVTSLTCGKMREGIISGREGVVMSGDLQLTAADDDGDRERERGTSELISRRNYRQSVQCGCVAEISIQRGRTRSENGCTLT